ncbi:hypothetical protein Taro_052371 [Colocasia esculenta]|uniref:Uncharacterized protein n=1 Tax=Colocasia esculenta TaxID=4460 RepID=A0A843XIE9_COLES|nr:hypothetical protein [Colocasia esculenta]
MADSTATCVDILLAIILPPLGVFLKFGCKVRGGVLDLPAADALRISPRHHLRCVRHHQVGHGGRLKRIKASPTQIDACLMSVMTALFLLDLLKAGSSSVVGAGQQRAGSFHG